MRREFIPPILLGYRARGIGPAARLERDNRLHPATSCVAFELRVRWFSTVRRPLRRISTTVHASPAPVEASRGWIARLEPRPAARYLAGMAALAAAYYVVAQGGYALQFTGSIAAIWPPIGLAVGVLYLGGLRWWPGVVIGDLLSNTWQAPTGTTVAVTVSNLAEVLVATLLLWRLIGRRAQLDRLDQVGRMLIAIVPSVAITATVGSLSLLADGVIHSHELLSVWRTLWLGDASGALVVLPLILAWAHAPAWGAGRTLEAAAMIGAVVGLSQLALSHTGALEFLVFPALIWAAVRFGQQGATLAVACAVGMAVWRTAHHSGPFVQHSITQAALSTQLYIAVAALTTLCLGAIVSERQSSVAEVVAAKRREVEGALEQRHRIARDLHDSVSQSLFSMNLHARTAQRLLAQTSSAPAGPVGLELDEVEALSRAALAEMRALIFELRPGGLAEEGLVAALTKHAAAVSAREEFAIDVQGPSERLPLSPDTEEHLYRIGQEALANVAKHAQAMNVHVTVSSNGELVVLEVRDDGRGFDPTATYVGHHGLESMRSRAAEIGTDIRVDSGPDRGTLVRVELPVDPGSTDL
jgi:signal transduction histidine kinase